MSPNNDAIKNASQGAPLRNLASGGLLEICDPNGQGNVEIRVSYSKEEQVNTTIAPSPRRKFGRFRSFGSWNRRNPASTARGGSQQQREPPCVEKETKPKLSRFLVHPGKKFNGARTIPRPDTPMPRSFFSFKSASTASKAYKGEKSSSCRTEAASHSSSTQRTDELSEEQEQLPAIKKIPSPPASSPKHELLDSPRLRAGVARNTLYTMKEEPSHPENSALHQETTKKHNPRLSDGRVQDEATLLSPMSSGAETSRYTECSYYTSDKDQSYLSGHKTACTSDREQSHFSSRQTDWSNYTSETEETTVELIDLVIQLDERNNLLARSHDISSIGLESSCDESDGWSLSSSESESSCEATGSSFEGTDDEGNGSGHDVFVNMFKEANSRRADMLSLYSGAPTETVKFLKEASRVDLSQFLSGL